MPSPVAGVACGLVTRTTPDSSDIDRYQILTDINVRELALIWSFCLCWVVEIESCDVSMHWYVARHRESKMLSETWISKSLERGME